MQIRSLFALAWLISATPAALSSTVQKVLDVEAQTRRSAVQSQQNVNKLSGETEQMLREYQRLMQQADYQAAYNLELDRRLQEQTQEIQKLQQQIADVQITRLHVMPLLRDTVAALKQFVELDLPFEREARLASIARLEQLLASGSVPIAEKFRRVMEAWQAESDYSYELHSYRDTLLLDDQELSVEFLRIGRSSWYFQTLDGRRSGYWQRDKQQWLILDGEYNSAIRQGIRLAQRQLAPQLLSLPVAATEVQ